jgi:hypothetical protein
MNARTIRWIPALAVLVTAVACNSSNPTRPSVSFGAPIAQQPANGVSYKYSEQPIALVIANAVRTGNATVVYSVEVSKTSDFASLAFSRENISEGGGGTTTVQIAVLDGAATYYWRWRAVIDGVVGEPSAFQSFFVKPNVELSTPQLVQPAANADVFSSRPTFTVANSSVTGPAGTIFYEFQVSTSAAFGTLVASATVQQQTGQTSWAPTSDLPEGALYWRARAVDPANDAQSDFSNASKFERKMGIDLASVVYVQGPNIANWPQTATITSAFHSGDTLCIESTANWPSTDFFDDPNTQVEGNQWLFVNIGGIWYGGAGHWYRPGQSCKGEVDENFFVDAFRSPPFNSLVLRSGDLFAVALSTPARLWPAMKTLDERSDVVFVVW